jgi:hypothetical protein
VREWKHLGINRDKTMKKAVFLFVCLLLLSCEQESLKPEDLGKNEGIIGTWVENLDKARGGDGSVFMNRQEELQDNSYGFVIRGDGTFLERKNAGWCGTPPITYDDFEGNWVARSDSLLDITVGYWGGVMNYQIRIVSLGEESLRIRFLYADGLAENK